MFILCDTSSILLLLRIAPDMFRDERFQCKTILDVHDEIFRTSKFKTKYPWIKELRARILELSKVMFGMQDIYQDCFAELV